tara:strand:+ start:1618 stop:3261 length:1644 start_codon:yes stop_codon:yes gene_type:complete
MSIVEFKKVLTAQLKEALASLGIQEENFQITAGKSPEHGDYSTNIALVLSKKLKQSPVDLANLIKGKLPSSSEFYKEVTVTNPGFINFTLSEKFLRQSVKIITEKGEEYGKETRDEKQTAMIEFVSANPTGPLTVGHGRQAVLGDIIANILSCYGFDVTREYYFNDAGRQMRLLGESVYYRYLEILGEKAEFPEGGYEGEYIKDIAQQINDSHGDSLKDKPTDPIFRSSAEESIFQNIKNTLEQIGIRFDNFVNEQIFYDNGAIENVLKVLRKKDMLYESEGATWLKTTESGKEQDTVLVKSSGEPTYRLPDIAYHEDKINRDIDLIVDLLGADHKDATPDVLFALGLLGYSTENIKVLFHQFVTLKQKGEVVKMSTRKATYVTLDDLIEQVGADVVRYFFIMRNMQSHLNFDLDLATKESDENPVYYLQYAHARIANIIKYGKESGLEFENEADLGLIKEPAEIALMKALIQLPEVMQSAVITMEPQQIANYLQEVANRFHKFYSECRVVTEDTALSSARLLLISATKNILANGLKILGINAPERM